MNRQIGYWSNSSQDRALFRSARNTSRKPLATRIISIVSLGFISGQKRSKTKKTEHQYTNAPARIPLATQFERAAQAVSTAVTKAEAIQTLHAETLQQLDATEYALHRLFDEIHSVMPGFEKPVYNNAVVRISEAEVFHPEALAA